MTLIPLVDAQSNSTFYIRPERVFYIGPVLANNGIDPYQTVVMFDGLPGGMRVKGSVEEIRKLVDVD